MLGGCGQLSAHEANNRVVPDPVKPRFTLHSRPLHLSRLKAVRGRNAAEGDRMLHSGFVVAMAAEIDVARYEQPTRILRRIKRWLVVSRLGPDGEHLTVSEGGIISDATNGAPIGIQPTKTLFGILLSEDKGNCTFILARKQPDRMPLAGMFFPAEGYVHLHGPIEALRLQAEGRHAHSHGRHEGREIRTYIADPAPNAKFAMAWHINAMRKPWPGEFIPRASD
jgi:hypothetical protein